jgi:hypothetical protein
MHVAGVRHGLEAVRYSLAVDLKLRIFDFNDGIPRPGSPARSDARAKMPPSRLHKPYEDGREMLFAVHNPASSGWREASVAW